MLLQYSTTEFQQVQQTTKHWGNQKAGYFHDSQIPGIPL